MAIIEIEDVVFPPRDSERLWGGYLDRPQAGSQTDGQAIEIAGWVLPRSGPAVAVEVVQEGVVIQRVPLTMRRPDLAKGFPQVPHAEQGGFRTRVRLGGAATHDIHVQAVLLDQQRVPLGTIRARRRWREQDYAAAAALVSVIIPCSNQAHALPGAIESVLAQTYPHFEIVVVHGSETDNTPAIAARYPGVRCVTQEGLGWAAACNTGLRHSNGIYLVFLDANDRLLPHALEQGLDRLQANPTCACVIGQQRSISGSHPAPTSGCQPLPTGDQYEALLRGDLLPLSATVLYRRSVFEAVRGFDPARDPAAQYDLSLRIASMFPIACSDQIVAEHHQPDPDLVENPALVLAAMSTALRAQWPVVKKQGQGRKAAYEQGVQQIQDRYGTAVVEAVRAAVRARSWQAARDGLRVLLRYHPRGFVLAAATYAEGWKQRNAVQQEIHTLSQYIQQLTAAQESSLREMSALRQAIEEREALQQRLDMLLNEQQAARNEIVALQQRLQERIAAHERAQREVADLQPFVEAQSDLQRRIADVTAENERAQAEVAALQQRIRELTMPQEATDSEGAGAQPTQVEPDPHTNGLSEHVILAPTTQ